MSQLGSEAITILTILLSKLDQSTHENLLAQYGNENFLKYFIEASALVDDGKFLPNIIRFLFEHHQRDSYLEMYLVAFCSNNRRPSLSEVLNDLKMMHGNSNSVELKDAILYTMCKIADYINNSIENNHQINEVSFEFEEEKGCRNSSKKRRNKIQSDQ